MVLRYFKPEGICPNDIIDAINVVNLTNNRYPGSGLITPYRNRLGDIGIDTCCRLPEYIIEAIDWKMKVRGFRKVGERNFSVVK